MLWLSSGMACLLAARLAAIWLCLSHRYPEWRLRRLAEGRSSGPLAFGMLHANPLFDGQGFWIGTTRATAANASGFTRWVRFFSLWLFWFSGDLPPR
ncbi:hypothetical protein ACFSS8_03970 [Paracoccus kondratievae]